MARLKKYLDTRASDNQERWLVSYADFVTLLLAFFVVMYAISSVNESKYRVVGSSIGTAFGSKGGPATPTAVQGPVVALPVDAAARAEAARRTREERVEDTQRRLAVALEPLVAQGEASVRQTGRGVVIDIGAGALFDTGEAALRQSAFGALRAAAEVLRSGKLPIEVEGHTDNEPIRGGRHPSNWELSTARAASVVRYFQGAGIAPERMSAVGYGEYRPVASNSVPEGRARNRRISIVVIDPPPQVAAPAPAQSYPPMEFRTDGRAPDRVPARGGVAPEG